MLKIYVNYDYSNNLVEKIYMEEIKINKQYKDILLDLDVLIFDKDEYTIEDVNEYLDFFSTKPFENFTKLSIFNNFDKLNIKQQNKMLKLFEENESPHIIFTKNPNGILQTIKSRSQIMYNNFKSEYITDGFPKRYSEVISLINADGHLEESKIDKYLKFYDLLKKDKYESLYLLYTLNIKDFEVDKIYNIFEFVESNRSTSNYINLLELQEALASNSIKTLHIEKYILNNIK